MEGRQRKEGEHGRRKEGRTYGEKNRTRGESEMERRRKTTGSENGLGKQQSNRLKKKHLHDVFVPW
jgi:hypothetical protein